jgi:hypothetical protein
LTYNGKNLAVLKKVMQLECPAVFTICWNYPDKELEKCIISTVQYNFSNCNTHFKSHRPEEIPYLLTDLSTNFLATQSQQGKSYRIN